MPDLASGVVAENANLPLPALQVAVGYYGECPDEIDRQIADTDAADESALRASGRTRHLLGI